jgi:restriction system protein
MNPNVYVLRADFGRYTDTFKKEKYIGIGWFQNEPSTFDLNNKDILKEEYKKIYPTDLPMRMNQNVGQIFRFVNEMKIGDIVISPFNTNELLVGKITSNLFHKKDDTSPYPWRKSVEWFPNLIDRHTLSVPLQSTLKSSLTCFRVVMCEEILSQIGLLSVKPVSNDEEISFSPKSNYELIRRKFLQLDPTEFELLVSYVLRSLGFDASQETGKVGDGGIDYEGVLDVFGVASINLQVQVKRYEKGVIGEKEIRNFRGALKKDYQGCFITLSTFNRKAIESAQDKERETIQLIDGTRFTDIFIEQYDKIIGSINEDDNDELYQKLKFKKSLIPN